MNAKTIDEADLYLAKRDDLHLARKIWHMSWGFAALVLYYSLGWTQKQAAYICLVIAVLAFAFDFFRLKTPAVNQLAFKIMGPFMRASEARKLSGLPYYALGMGLSLYFFDNKIAILSILYLTFSDPLSSLFGILFGKIRLLPGKSFEGSFTGFCVCYCLTILFAVKYGEQLNGIILFALIAGIIGSISELASALKIDDNLTIPVLSGAGLTLLNQYFLIF